VWAPAAVYPAAVDQAAWGVFLFLYGGLVISMIDNYARPIVIDRGAHLNPGSIIDRGAHLNPGIIIDRGAHLNPGVVLIGVFSGVYAIGMTGLFLGPVAIAVLAATVTALDEEYDALASGIEAWPVLPCRVPGPVVVGVVVVGRRRSGDSRC
jgi:hypothetical protein